MHLASPRAHARTHKSWRAVALSTAVALVAALFVALPSTAASAAVAEDSYGPLRDVSVTGRLLAPDGSAVPNARVIADATSGDGENGLLGETMSGSNGEFELQVRASRSFLVRIVPTTSFAVATVKSSGGLYVGTAWSNPRVFPADVDGTYATGDLTLTASGSIGGTVRVTGLTKFINARVLLTSSSHSIAVPVVLGPGANAWSIGVPNGTYMASVVSENVGLKLERSAPVSVTASANVRDVDFAGLVNDRTISGKVRKSNGEPVSASVFLNGSAGVGRATQTNLDGEYTLINVPAGTFKLNTYFANQGVFYPNSPKRECAQPIIVESSSGSLGGFDLVVDDLESCTTEIGIGTASITGGPWVGETLMAEIDTQYGDSVLSYQWSADGEPIDGAVEPWLPVDESLVGKIVGVVVTASAEGHHDSVATATMSHPIQMLEVGGIVPGRPSVVGSPRVGKTLTIDPGMWSEGVEFAYQWHADGQPLVGETGANLTVTPALLDKRISATITGSREGYASVSVDTAATWGVEVGVLDAPVPTITGTPRVGSQLTVHAGSWPAGTKLAYEWFASGDTISGEASSTYVPQASDLGKTIAVQVTGTLPGYEPASAISSPTAAVESLHVTQIRHLPLGSTRLAGGDRYATALEVSALYAGNVPVVFVATGQDFPDALSAASAASLLGGPLLLTPSTKLTEGVRQEIERLNPARIYAVGGTGAVSNGVFTALSRIAPTERLGAGDRYSTGLRIVDETFTSAATAFIATGRSFPDALAATGAAGASGAPVILVDGAKTQISAGALQTLDRLGVSDIEIAGGTGAVSSAIEKQLRGLGYRVTRHGGGDRYATAATINNAFFGNGASDTMFLATGANFPDALAGAALAGRLGAPLYVTSAQCVPEPVRNSISDLTPSKKVVMGGTTIVSNAAASNTGCLAASVPTISGSAKVKSTLTANPGAWTSGASFAYQWYANGAAISGATAAALTLGTSHAGKKITVKVTGSKPGYTTAAKTSKPTATVGYPNRTTPVDTWNCPSWAPIKGNASSMIYHVPSARYYKATNPEECFRTEGAAKDAGYRKAKV